MNPSAAVPHWMKTVSLFESQLEIHGLESLSAVLTTTGTVFVLDIFLLPLEIGTIVMFLCSVIILASGKLKKRF